MLVVLSVHISNQGAERLARLQRDTLAVLAKPHAPERPHHRQRQRKLDGTAAAEIAVQYQAGSSMKALGAQYGVHEATVCLILQRLGVARRGGIALTAEQAAEAQQLHAAGASYGALGQRYGCTGMSVARAITRLEAAASAE